MIVKMKRTSNGHTVTIYPHADATAPETEVRKDNPITADLRRPHEINPAVVRIGGTELHNREEVYDYFQALEIALDICGYWGTDGAEAVKRILTTRDSDRQILPSAP